MLADHGPMTRREIAERLARRRIPVQGQAIAHLVWMAAARCRSSTARTGTATPVSCARVTGSARPRPPRDRDAAFRELAIRYLRAHGPAAPHDLAVWSGLGAGTRSARGPRSPIAWSRSAVRRNSAGRCEARASPSRRDVVRLLPAFDDYLLGWRDRSFAVRAGSSRHGEPRWRHDPSDARGRRHGGGRLATIDDGRLRLEPFGPLPRPVERRARPRRPRSSVSWSDRA